jgi:hypothetical protein
MTQTIPGGNGAAWEASDMDGARQGERTGVSESIEDKVYGYPRRV